MDTKIRKELIDELLSTCDNPSDILGKDGLIKNLVKSLIETALDGELAAHLGYAKHDSKGNNSGNSRNGTTTKKVRSDHGEIKLTIPRDRKGTFTPVLVEKHERSITGFEDKILALYAMGTSTRDIKEHLEEIYGVKVSAEFISSVTASVVEDLKKWQNRPLENIYPIVYLDAMVVKIREEFCIKKKAVNLAIGVNTDGERDILGMWICKNEGAKFWLSVMQNLQNRGVQDIFIACVDGLKGFPEAIEVVFPKTEVQTCIIHMVRNSLKFVCAKERTQVARALKLIYKAVDEESALEALEKLKELWDQKYPQVSKSWENNWEHVAVIFKYPKVIRDKIYTTNVIESLNNFIRKVIKNKRLFPNESSATKLIYLAIQRKLKKWNRRVDQWSQVRKGLELYFKDRLIGK